MSSIAEIMNKRSIYGCNVEALIEELGVVGMLRYLEKLDNGGSGDYTKEKYEMKEMSIEEIVACEV